MSRIKQLKKETWQKLQHIINETAPSPEIPQKEPNPLYYRSEKPKTTLQNAGLAQRRECNSNTPFHKHNHHCEYASAPSPPSKRSLSPNRPQSACALKRRYPSSTRTRTSVSAARSSAQKQ